MQTITDLVATLAGALGVPRRLVEETARYLREAEMLPEGKEQAAVEHAVTLLLALMAVHDPEDAPSCVRLYLEMPFDCAMCYEMMPSGRFEGYQVPDADPLVSNIRQFGIAFGSFLETLILAFNEVSETSATPTDISLGGGLGTARASVRTLILMDDVNVSINMQFALDPGSGYQIPDDAPAGRLDRYTTVQGQIFTAFRKFFTGSTGGPREVFLTSRPDSALTSRKES